MVFHFTEADYDMSYFTAFYMCFVTFSTIGYGDYTPRSPAGRGFFIVYSLLGIGMLTILIAVLSDGWASSYKKSIARGIRRRNKRDRQRRGAPALSSGTSLAKTLSPGANGHAASAGDDDTAPATPINGLSASRPAMTAELERYLDGDGSEVPAGLRAVPHTETDIENLPIELARAGLRLHEHATHFLVTQGTDIHEALSTLRSNAGIPTEAERQTYDKDELQLMARLADAEGDVNGKRAVHQVLAMRQMEEMVRNMVKHAHAVKYSISQHKEEVASLHEKISQLEEQQQQQQQQRQQQQPDMNDDTTDGTADKDSH